MFVLEKVKISQNLCGTRILQSSFEKCENLISFEANSLLNISSALVSECKNLETFTISGLFRDSKILVSTYGCPKLSEVSLSNANYLLLDAFVSVETLEYIYFYNSDINFSKYSFNNCPLFKNIILIGSKIDVIESFAFYKCPLLEFDSSISLRMESHAFQESCLQTFTFNVSVIPSYAISGSLTLKYIRITKTVTYISAHFIEQCPNFISLEFLDPESDGNDLIIGNEAFWKMDTFDLSSRLPKRLIKIGDEAFSGCSKITGSLFIPQKLTSIGNYAFANCIGLNGILDFTINNVLENISSYAFLGCSLRGSLVFPNSLKKIGACSFSYCKFNGPLVIPDNVNRIEKYAFALCSSFTGSLIIGNNVEYIGSFAFSECNGFNGQLEFHTKKLRRIGKNAFFLCSSLKGNLVLPNTLEWIGDFAFFDCHNLKGLSLPNSLLHIGDSTFAYCTGFTETLNLPKNLNHIGTNAFFQCEGFTKIEFDKQIASDKIIIGNKAFGNLKITCLSNVPKTCEGNASNTNRCYDSTNFAWYHTSSNIRESCSATEAVRITQRVIEIICSLGIIGIAYKIVKCIRQYCGKEKHLEAIFDELIQEAKENYEKDYRNQK